MTDRLQVDPAAHAIAGGIGGALSMVVTYPLVTLSTLAQTNSSKLTGSTDSTKSEPEKDLESGKAKKQASTALDAIKALYNNSGVLGFYAGLESAIFGIIVNNVVYYYFYEALTKVVLTRKKATASSAKVLNSFESIIIGAIAGSITVFSTNPIWVANTRITVSKDSKKLTTIGALMDIIKTDGPLALFRGVLPALILVTNPIIQYTIFEQLKNFINKRSKKGLTSIHAFFIGALGKLIATGSTYPYITLKSRMHLQKEGEKDTVLGMIRKILDKEGIAGFYNGVFVKLSQSVLTAAFLFFFKEELTASSLQLLKLIRSLKNVQRGKVTA
ncbi:hypothetical protein WICPIJ_000023 [Wickerhamomyces pijperi]|uniref:Peroxisomal membrane protein PMP47B n=1 Tax=Wickerhamomyces pijperi TaxID=599730 RepID=A0A9P8QHY2_WICPI|nr:hypothetical protein WICPIJ_000023 [Wickerhamomyces pijperi]